MVDQIEGLRQQLAAKEAEAAAMREALFKLGEYGATQSAATAAMREALQAEINQYHLDSDGGYIQHEDGSFECAVCGSPDGPSRGQTREQVVHVPDCRQAVHDRSEAALFSTAGADLLARLRAAESVAFTGLIRCRRCGRTAIWERQERDIEIINECCSQSVKWQERAKAAEEKAAALDWLDGHLKIWGSWPGVILREGRACGSCDNIHTEEGEYVAETLLAAIQAARAKEPADAR